MHLVKPSDRFVTQIDLFKIHHFDNKARATSLKVLEFNMRSDSIEDLPFRVGTVLTREQVEVLKKYNQHDVSMTKAFYHKHGGKAVIIGRFLPIIRTFVPFVAGTARMPWARFTSFNIIGAFLWVGGLLLAGYFLGRLPWVKAYLTPFLLLIIVVSLFPAFVAWLRNRKPVVKV